MDKKKIYGIIALVGIGLILKKILSSDVTIDSSSETADEPTPQTQVIIQDQIVVLDGSKILKIGSKGYEVKELQRLLGLSQDGVFGKQTETFLFNRKGVKEISLYKFQSIANVIPHKFKIGDTLIINSINGVMVSMMDFYFPSTYKLNSETIILKNNEVAGKVVKLTVGADGKTPSYIVKDEGILTNEYFAISEKNVR